MPADWLVYVNEPRRRNLLHILHELSNLQNPEQLNFIIIGALPLLMRGYLRYAALWDIDLLFKDEKTLRAFTALPKSPMLTIVNYDDQLMSDEGIASLHTAWSFNKTWFNVDYLVRDGIFRFYTDAPHKPHLYSETIRLGAETFDVDLITAHPWDIVIDKLVSPRTEKAFDLRIDMSVDIRHLITIYRQEKNNPQFWSYIIQRAHSMQGGSRVPGNFLRLFSLAHELGYTDLDVPSHILDMMRSTMP
jgi:hypothetical protein